MPTLSPLPPKAPICKRVIVEETTQVGEARRMAQLLAGGAGFSQTTVGRIGIVVTEAANNLIKHAKGGEILLQCFDLDGIACFDLLAIDRGCGMSNIAECQRDGYSTSGTPGTGLGAMRRQSDVFDLYSQPGKGTVVFARWQSESSGSPRRQAFEIGAACVPHPRETVPGDRWSVRFTREPFQPEPGTQAEACVRPGLQVMIADGLGHGTSAAEAAEAAIAAFQSPLPDRTPERLLQVMHGKLRSTRGAAISIAELSSGGQRSRYAGLGNVAGAVLQAADRKQFASLHGTVGHQSPKIRGFDYPWSRAGLLVLHSDGIQSRCCDLSPYPGLSSRHPGVIAAVLLRDFKRSNDDATVLVAKESA
jgi:anti-sigma regulatory factor (Ser/Thr protein kinase)